MISIEYAPYFHSLYVITALILCGIMGYQIRLSDSKKILGREKYNPAIIMWMLAILIAILLGMRPISGRYFGDTGNYALRFNPIIGVNYIKEDVSFDEEWLWTRFIEACQFRMDANGFFIIVDLLYFILTCVAMTIMLKGNAYFGFLMFLGAFSTYSYSINGIRNGLACALMCVLITVFIKKRNYFTIPLCALLGFFALGIHRSVMLPLISLVGGFYIKKIKISMWIWVFSIILFLLMGNTIGNFFAELGFDDRMESYMDSAEEYALEHKSGFRWDFLLYSAMPIWLAYTVLVKHKIKSKSFLILANTYILANSFWIVVMGASFSNRFAYLSWFMYPLVLAYPCMKLDVWNQKQGSLAARILMANVGFTAFMTFIYYG